jgi:hypothetical protein
MEKPAQIYELLLDYAASDTQVTELSIGLVWTVCKAQQLGLAMSPDIPTRTLSWPGTLVGKTVELHEFGIDYLAGLEVVDPVKLYQTAAEGGGVRIFENGARYRIVELTPGNSMTWLKNRIAQDYNEKQQLTLAMEQWYSSGKNGRFPEFNQLHQVTTRLSRMDSSYKRLWDAHHAEPS